MYTANALATQLKKYILHVITLNSVNFNLLWKRKLE